MEPLQFFEDAHCSVEKPSLFVPRQKGLVIRAFRLRSKRPIAILFYYYYYYYYYYSFSGHITVEGSGKSIECM